MPSSDSTHCDIYPDMTRSSHLSTNALRRRAEQLLNDSSRPQRTGTEQDVRRVLHELDVHDVELALQNEELQRSRNALEEAHDRYQSLFELAPVPYLTLEADSTVVEANAAARELMARTAGLVGATLATFVDESSVDAFWRHIAKACDQWGARHVRELSFLSAHGHGFPVRLATVCTPPSGGHPQRLRMAITDLTALRETQALYWSVFDSTGACILEFSPDFRVLRANAAACRLLCRAERELRQMAFIELAHPDDVAAFHGALLSARGRAAEHTSLELRLVTSAGDAAWVHASVSWLFDARGEPMRGVVVLQDVTEAKRAQAELQAIVDTAADAVITVDGRRIITSFNPAAVEMFGYAAAEVIGRDVCSLMPAETAQAFDAAVEEFRRSGAPPLSGGHEVVAERRDGSVFPVHVSVADLQVAGTRKFTGIVRDLTERRRADEVREALLRDLANKNAELTRFVYTVSHDLKSPLITMKGFAGMLRQDLRDENVERALHDVGRIEASADHMSSLLDSLLALSRVGRTVELAENVSLREIVENVCEQLHAWKTETGAEIIIADDLPSVRGDRVRLGEVFQNLLENALKFTRMREAPLIEVGVRRDGARGTVVFVRDNGIGVEPRHFERVFSLFSQLDPDEPGTGVGLALVQRIIETHGGEVWVESSGADGGACFCFTVA